MSLIIINKNTLRDVAIVTISNEDKDLTFTTKNDLTIIKSKDKVVGLNVHNFKKYFDADEGAHVINNSQVKAIGKMGFNIENPKSMFSIGKVFSRTEHPKSKKLFVLEVETDKVMTIVTNSLNSVVGAMVVVANVGATLPSGLPIILSKVMGVESNGMLCGGETLGKEKTDGVLIVKGQAGQEYVF